MMELRRRVLKPIGMGDLCSMNGVLRESLLLTQDYQDNGNVRETQRNYLKKLHRADVKLFYCNNASAFNSKELIEIIPVLFLHDGSYGDASFKLALRHRMKLIVSRDDYNIVESNIESLDSQSMIKRNVELISKKFNLNLDKWNEKLASR